MRGVAATRARLAPLAAVFAVPLPVLAVLAFGGPVHAQSIPRGLGGGVGTSGLGGIDTFGVHGDPLSPDPLARGSGLSAYVAADERASISNSTSLYGELSVGGTAFLNRDRAEASGTGAVTLRQPEVSGRGAGKTRFLVTGLGRGAVDLIRNQLVLDLSAYADVLSRDQSNGTTINPQDQIGNLSQIYLISAQPRYRHEIGTVALFDASYRASYVSVTGINGAGNGTTSNGGAGIGGSNSTPSLQPLSNTFTQAGEASISNQPGDGRFIIKLSGNVSGEAEKRLEQRFRSRGGSLDITYAVTRPIALLGNVGYEDYKSSEQAILRAPIFVTRVGGVAVPTAVLGDPNLFTSTFFQKPVLVAPANTYPTATSPALFLGQGFTSTRQLTDPTLFVNPFSGQPLLADITPVLGPNGDFQADPSGLRQTTYAQKGLVWNAGFRYAPSRRTSFELRVGQRFSTVTVTGSLLKTFRSGLTVVGSLTDGIETFSSILTETINGVPTSFVGSGRAGASLGGCLKFAPDGSCNDLQSLTTGVFRSRYGTLSATLPRGLTSYSIAYVYNYRRYLDAGATQIADPTFAKRSDTIQRIYATAIHRLDERQRIEGGLFFGENNLGLTRRTNDTYFGALANYDIKLSSRIDGFARADLTERISGVIGNNTYATIALGARYSF